MNPTKPIVAPANDKTSAAQRESLTITDNRTGRQYEVPVQHDTIRAIDLRQIKVNEDDFGMMSYDPASYEHGIVHQPHHIHRRRQRHSAISRLSH